MTKNKDLQDKHEENEDINVQSSENAEAPANEDHLEETLENNKEQNKAHGEIERLKAELSEAKDKYLRLYSEFENFRRRSAKERLDLVQTANQDLLRDLLPVIDDFDRATQNFNENTDASSIKEGMDLISNKFYKILEQKGVKEMEGKQGIDFDPEIHEAITQIPAPNNELKGKVVDVIEKGYYLHDKVIRFAKVVVGS